MKAIKCPDCKGVGTLYYRVTKTADYPVIVSNEMKGKVYATLGSSTNLGKSGITLCTTESCTYEISGMPDQRVLQEVPTSEQS